MASARPMVRLWRCVLSGHRWVIVQLFCPLPLPPRMESEGKTGPVLKSDERGKRQRDGKTGASSHLAFHTDRAAMCPNYPFDNGESQSTTTAPGPEAASIGSVESLKDMGQVFWRNPDARITNHQAS